MVLTSLKSFSRHLKNSLISRIEAITNADKVCLFFEYSATSCSILTHSSIYFPSTRFLSLNFDITQIVSLIWYLQYIHLSTIFIRSFNKMLIFNIQYLNSIKYGLGIIERSSNPCYSSFFQPSDIFAMFIAWRLLILVMWFINFLVKEKFSRLVNSSNSKQFINNSHFILINKPNPL